MKEGLNLWHKEIEGLTLDEQESFRPSLASVSKVYCYPADNLTMENIQVEIYKKTYKKKLYKKNPSKLDIMVMKEKYFPDNLSGAMQRTVAPCFKGNCNWDPALLIPSHLPSPGPSHVALFS